MYTGQDFAESQFNPVDAERPPDRFDVQGDHARDRARSGLLARTTASAAARSTVDSARTDGLEPRRLQRRDARRSPTRSPTSNNCAFVRTLLSLGPGHYGDDGAQPVIDMAGRLGIDTLEARRVPVADARHRRAPTCSTWPRRSRCSPTTGVHRDPTFITQDRRRRRQGDLRGRHRPDTACSTEQIARTETRCSRA